MTRGFWSQERDALAIRLSQEGQSASQIAERLGRVSRNAVIGRLHRLGQGTPKKPSAEWPEDRTERLKALRQEGLTCAEIARALGATRNAVLTKLSRLGIPAPEKRSASAPRAHGIEPPTLVVVGENAPSAAAPRPLAPAAAVERAPDGIGVRLLDRRRAQCAYPLGVDAAGDHMCCGLTIKADDRPYCPGHCDLMYRPTPPMREVRSRGPGSRRLTRAEAAEDIQLGLDGEAA